MLSDELALKVCSLRWKATKSSQGEVKFSLISKGNKAKETVLVVSDLWLNAGNKYSCNAIKEMTDQPKGYLTRTHELLMMFVFIQWCFYIICQE